MLLRGGGGGGGNVYNVMLHVNAATLRGITSFFCVSYNMVSENHSVHNSPWGGGGVYSQLMAIASFCQFKEWLHNYAIS